MFTIVVLMYLLGTCVCVCTWRPEVDAGSSGDGVLGSCEPPSWLLELTSDPLQEQFPLTSEVVSSAPSVFRRS